MHATRMYQIMTSLLGPQGLSPSHAVTGHARIEALYHTKQPGKRHWTPSAEHWQNFQLTFDLPTNLAI